MVMMQTSGFAFCEADGRCSGYRGIDKDITERVRAEQERALIENRMQVAQKMEAVGQLAGGIAHDFNNILGAIAGYADMIKQLYGGDNKRLVKYADTILAAATRAADLTTKLLNFARKGSYQVVRIDINHALADLVGLLSHSLDKRISTELRATAADAWVKADPSQLHNVLMSLAVNAADALPQGGRLTFETSVVHIDSDFIKRHRYEMVEAAYLVIAVTDNGIGMDSQTRARVFEPFFTTKEPGRGTGLGLASAYGIIKTMGGAINVYTELGMGTTFRIYLPLSEEHLPHPPLALTAPPRLLPSSGLVLLVDDERFMLDICRDMLMAQGYDVAEFDNPDDALRWYEVNHSRVRLAIIDMIMPAATGNQCLKRLLGINPQLRAILATGFAFTDDIEELLQEGFCGYIQKPFVMKQLAEIVQTVLDQG
jgi:nitrogen-specific signal transduction histidine kinase/CheY-like chemotaxis protein